MVVEADAMFATIKAVCLSCVSYALAAAAAGGDVLSEASQDGAAYG